MIKKKSKKSRAKKKMLKIRINLWQMKMNSKTVQKNVKKKILKILD
jgi:hypothetical protein